MSAAELFAGREQGFALLAVAGVYAAVAAALYPRHERREVAVLVLAVGLTACAVGLADVLSGSSLAYTWAAEAVLLAYLCGRLRDGRFLIGSLVYVLLALGHALAFDAPLEQLFVATRHPAGGAGVAAAVAAGALAFA